MSLPLPRKRTLMAWHRWLGFLATLFLIVLSLTGLALNHTELLHLDKITLRNDFILKRYGMAGGSEIISYRIGNGDTLSYLDGQLFFNQSPLQASEPLVGIYQGDAFTIAASSDTLHYLTPEGASIESIDTNLLPFDTIRAIGASTEGASIIAAANGHWLANADWLEFTSFTAPYQVTPLETTELSTESRAAILTAFQGEGISLYRALLDLHSGRLFGWGGRTVMDLTAIAILLLISSGIAGYFRKSRRKQIT